MTKMLVWYIILIIPLPLLALSDKEKLACFKSIQSPPKQRVLQIIEDGLKTCQDIDKIQRNDSAFRMYANHFLYEVDLGDINITAKNLVAMDPILSLECLMYGCIDVYMRSEKPYLYGSSIRYRYTWEKQKSVNFLTFNCGEYIAARISYLMLCYQKME